MTEPEPTSAAPWPCQTGSAQDAPAPADAPGPEAESIGADLGVEHLVEIFDNARRNNQPLNGLFDQLADALGHDEAQRRWNAAWAEADHYSNIEAATKELTEALNRAATALAAADRVLGRLRCNELFAVEYAEGDAGADLARTIDDAGWLVRCAVYTNENIIRGAR